jgi:hypothetical protein
MSERVSTWFTDRIVSDSKAIQAYYTDKFKTPSTFIAYGAHIEEGEAPGILAEYDHARRRNPIMILFEHEIRNGWPYYVPVEDLDLAVLPAKAKDVAGWDGVLPDMPGRVVVALVADKGLKGAHRMRRNAHARRIYRPFVRRQGQACPTVAQRRDQCAERVVGTLPSVPTTVNRASPGWALGRGPSWMPTKASLPQIGRSATWRTTRMSTTERCCFRTGGTMYTRRSWCRRLSSSPRYMR